MSSRGTSAGRSRGTPRAAAGGPSSPATGSRIAAALARTALARPCRPPRATPRPASSRSASRASPTAAPRRRSTARTSSASTRYPGLGRLAVGWRETHGSFRAVFRGYVERTWGTRGDETDWVVRQGYAQYWWGEKVGLRVGKQRIAWGSGFAWNPTNRLEPPKNALNTTLEQEGALAARLDWAPAAGRASSSSAPRPTRLPRDLPVAAAEASAATPSPLARALPGEGHGPGRSSPPAGRTSARSSASTSGATSGGRPSTPRPPSTRAPRCSRPATTRSSSASWRGAADERGERLRPRVLLQRRGLLRRGSRALARRARPRLDRGDEPRPPARAAAAGAREPTPPGRPSRTRAASACAATTCTRRGRAAGRPPSGRAPCARSSASTTAPSRSRPASAGRRAGTSR